MFANTNISLTTAVLALSTLTRAAPHNLVKRAQSDLSLTAQLQLADLTAERYALLPNDSDFVYDYNKSDTGLADRKSFPALEGLGGSLAIADFPPCSMAALHIHPHATEIFLLISGNIITEMVPEAGVLTANGTQRVIRTELKPKQMTVFPQGAFHAQINPYCESAQAVAAFTSDDPGAGFVAPQTFALTDDFVEPTFGEIIKGEDLEKVRHAIPQAVIFRLDECVKKCGGNGKA